MKESISGTTVAVGALLIIAVGIAAGATTLPVTEPVSVDNETAEIEVVVSNITDDDTGDHTDANLTLYGVSSDGGQNVVAETTISTSSSNDTVVWVYGDGENETINHTEYPEYSVQLEANSSTNTSVGTLNLYPVKAGGGGGLLGGDNPLGSIPTEAVVGGGLLVALGLVAWRAN